MDQSIEPEVAYKMSEIARFEGVTTRSLFEWIKAGRFPKPDIPAQRKGEANRWYGRTLRRVREERSQRIAAATQPATPTGVAA